MLQYVLIGLGPQGLYLLRELASQNVQVVTISRKDEIGYYSKFGRKLVICNEAELMNIVSRMCANASPRTLCYITSGFYLSYIIRHFPEAYEMMEIYPRPMTDVKLLDNKMKTYDLARSSSIPVPVTHTLSQIDKTNAFNSIQYPAIVKWNSNIHLFSRPKFKTKVVFHPNELTKLSLALTKHEKANLVVQKFLYRDLDQNLSFGGYFVNGNCILEILVNQVRQYPLGISSYVKEYSGDFASDLIRASKRIFKKLNFTGFAEVEFKLDQDYSSYYLLEVNPRPWGWMSVLKQKYPEICKVLLNPEIDLRLTPASQRCEWVNLLRDVAGIGHNSLKEKSLGLFIQELTSYRKKKVFDVLHFSDLQPFFQQVTRKLS